MRQKGDEKRMRRGMRAVSRRGASFSALVVLALVAVGWGTTGQSAAQAQQKLVFVSPGGSYARAAYAAYLQPFQEATRTMIEQVEGGDDPVAAIKTQVKSGNVLWDVVGCGPADVVGNPGIWEPIDYSIVKSTRDLVYKEAAGQYNIVNDVETFPALAYSTKAFPHDGPTSWTDFFDVTKFPGPRGLSNVGLDSAWSIPAIALLADGVSPDKLVPFDLDRAYKKLDTIKPQVRVFWTSFTQSQDVLRSGEVVMNVMTDGRALQLVNTGNPVAVSFKQAFRFTASWCAPKGAPHAKNVMRLFEYILSHPQKQAIFTSLTFYGPPTRAGVAEAEKLGIKEFSSKHADELIPDSGTLLNYIKEHSDELLKRWNAWVS